jgi:hypothetical protein
MAVWSGAMRRFGMAVVLLTTLSYNCVPVIAQPEQLFAQGDISDGNQSVTLETA